MYVCMYVCMYVYMYVCIHIIGKIFYTCRLAFELNFVFDLARCTFSTRFVKLHSQTMQFSTRQTNFYTLLLFISFDA